MTRSVSPKKGSRGGMACVAGSARPVPVAAMPKAPTRHVRGTKRKIVRGTTDEVFEGSDCKLAGSAKRRVRLAQRGGRIRRVIGKAMAIPGRCRDAAAVKNTFVHYRKASEGLAADNHCGAGAPEYGRLPADMGALGMRLARLLRVRTA